MPDEVPPPLPPRLPPLPAARNAPVAPPAATTPAPVAAPVATPAAASTVPVEAVAPVRGWWAWWLGSGLAAFVLFFVCVSCNPATTATDRALARLQALMAEHLGNELHPLLSVYVTPFINSYLALPYAQMHVVGVGFAFTVFVLLPLGASLLSSAISHPLFLIGGAPGGWRRTWANFGLHRVVCDGLTLLALAFVLLVPLPPTLAGGLLLVLLPLIRVGSLVFLWVSLARGHRFGLLRHLFLGLPLISFGSFGSIFVATLAAAWFYAYLLARLI
jgi:hypothetical protein